MEPNQNVRTNGIRQTTANTPIAPVSSAPTPAPTKASETPTMEATGVKKSGKGVLLGMVLLGILAVGGIAFGVWEMMDGNKRVEDLNGQISTLRTQNSELNTRIAELEEEIAESNNTDDGYLYMDGIGLKIKQSDDFPDMAVELVSDGHYVIKESSDLPSDSSAPSVVSWIKGTTCDSAELFLGYGAKMEVGNTCYIMGEILPYGSDDEHPLTDFLVYVMNSENYSEI